MRPKRIATQNHFFTSGVRAGSIIMKSPKETNWFPVNDPCLLKQNSRISDTVVPRAVVSNAWKTYYVDGICKGNTNIQIATFCAKLNDLSCATC